MGRERRSFQSWCSQAKGKAVTVRWAGRKNTGSETVKELSLVSWTLWEDLIQKRGVMENTARARVGAHRRPAESTQHRGPHTSKAS